MQREIYRTVHARKLVSAALNRLKCGIHIASSDLPPGRDKNDKMVLKCLQIVIKITMQNDHKKCLS